VRRTFDREGLGYAMHVPELAIELAVDRLARTRGGLEGDLSISMGAPGTRSSDGYLHGARVNLSSGPARGALARVLAKRAGTDDSLDWEDLLEDFCRRVLGAERQGSPVEVVGDMPTRIAPAWRLDPILPSDKPTILYGEGGTGKSTLATAIAVSVETGVAVIEGWIPRRAPVLYLDWETSPDDVDEHVKGVARGANIPGPVTLRYRRCFGPLVDQVDEIARLVAIEKIGLLVVDSIGLAAGSSGDGTDASESAIRLFSAFRAIGTTVLAIDHVSKGDALDPTKPARPYGSIYKTNLARATFELRRATPMGSVARIGVYNTKSNVRQLLPPMGLESEHSDDGVIRFVPFDIALDVELGRKASVWDRARAALSEAGPMTDEELVEELEVKANVLRSTLSRVARQGLVERLPSSRKWSLINAS
jgi:KaiC/GvpD/RAD55 family RecA-like ATPase